MYDPRHRRHDAEIAKCLLSPFQKFIAFAVALKFNFGVALEGILRGKEINLHRMVDDQIYWHERIDLSRITAKTGNCRAHRSKIHNRGYSREILHDDTSRQKWNAST